MFTSLAVIVWDKLRLLAANFNMLFDVLNKHAFRPFILKILYDLVQNSVSKFLNIKLEVSRF